MGLVAGICKTCGGKIIMDDSKKAGICEHCSTPYSVEDVINYTKIDNHIDYVDNLVVNDETSVENRLKNALASYYDLDHIDDAEEKFSAIAKGASSDYRGWLGVAICKSKLLLEKISKGYDKEKIDGSEIYDRAFIADKIASSYKVAKNPEIYEKLNPIYDKTSVLSLSDHSLYKEKVGKLEALRSKSEYQKNSIKKTRDTLSKAKKGYVNTFLGTTAFTILAFAGSLITSINTEWNGLWLIFAMSFIVNVFMGVYFFKIKPSDVKKLESELAEKLKEEKDCEEIIKDITARALSLDSVIKEVSELPREIFDLD